MTTRGPCVVHCRRRDYEVYIGRPSKWGNPYVIGADGNREEVIAKFEVYLRARPDLMAALPELRGKVLGCYCAPKPCHGDVLLRLANQPTEPLDEGPCFDEGCEPCG